MGRTDHPTHCICGTELVMAPGIGLYCPNEACEVVDGPFDGSEPVKFEEHMSNDILERVARAMVAQQMEEHCVTGVTLEQVRIGIQAFLQAAAEQGWHMRRDKLTKETLDMIFDELGIFHTDATSVYHLAIKHSPEFEVEP